MLTKVNTKKKIALTALTTAVLAACGGGGDHGSGLRVTLDNADITSDSNYVNVTDDPNGPNVASVILKRAVDFLAGREIHADGNFPSPSGRDITRKIVGDQLLDINIKLRAASDSQQSQFEELDNKCAFGNPEIAIEKITSIDHNGKMNIVQGYYPDTYYEDCTVGYSFGTFIIAENGDAFEMEDHSLAFRNFIKANDPLYNISSMPLFENNNEKIVTAIVHNEASRTLDFEQLTPPTLEVYTDRFLAFDGSYLVTLPTSSGDDAYLFERGKEGFISMDRGDTVLNGMFFNNDGQFMTGAPPKDSTNEDFGGFSIFDPIDQSVTAYPDDPGHGFGGFFTISFLTRNGPKIVNYAYQIWDMDTNQVSCVFPDENAEQSGCQIYGATKRKFYKDYIVAFHDTGDKFYRYDLKNGELVGDFDLSNSGYVMNRDNVTLYQDVAYAEIVNSSNANKEFIEINLITGTVSNHGVIQDGQKQVKTFLVF